MPIIFHEKTKVFHLYNRDISYLFQIIDNQQLGHLYYGKRLTDHENFGHLFEKAKRDMAPYTFEGDTTFSLEHIKQEYPAYGCGDMRYPAFEIERFNGSRVIVPVYKSHRIIQGKPGLKGLPATYVEAAKEAVTLEVLLEDEAEGLRIFLLYTLYEEMPVIVRSARYECTAGSGAELTTAMSGCIDLPDRDYRMIDLAGAWARERDIRERELDYGIQGVYSMRGCSSYQFNPFLALKRKNTDEQTGEVIGCSLVYSGNFLAQVEVDNYDVARVLMGIHPSGFRWKLNAGEEFQTPEMVLVYSAQGLNHMSQVYHHLYRTRLARGSWRDRVRPVLINNWEATYFDFDEERLVDLAGRAASLGIELFVMDDGWFGSRNDATSSLGDWYPNTQKLPGGVKRVAQRVRALGMKFGIWIEPEMVNRDSDLYRSRPEWVLGECGKNLCHSRNQYILDFSKEEVVEYLCEQISKVLREAQIDYVKWDMNRTFSEVYSNGKDREYQGKVCHKYILGVYAMYERLTAEFPEILFESCASGGARFDPGMLYYAPQAWTSDNTDAVSRLKIQYGTSLVYPLSSMGAHVSASPNHQTHRSAAIGTRAAVAYFGIFGYELDLKELGDTELQEIKKQVAFMKQYRKLIQQGVFYRLKSPFEGNVTAWMVVSPDQREAVAGYYRVMQLVNAGFERIRLQGLRCDMKYTVSGKNYTCYGDELMQIGILTSDESSGIEGEQAKIQGDFMNRIFVIREEQS